MVRTGKESFDFFDPFSAEVTYGEYVLFIGMKGIGTLPGEYIVEKAIPIDYDPDLFLPSSSFSFFALLSISCSLV